LASLGLSFIRKKADNDVVYFVSNLGDKFSQGQVNLAIDASVVEFYDPLKGINGITDSRIVDGKTVFNLHLEPGQSCILKCSDAEPSGQKWTDYSAGKEVLKLNEWTITAVNEAANLPQSVKMDKLRSWAKFGDPWSVYSGKALYSSEFEIDEKYIGQEMLIDLGDVRETARVKINNVDIGLLWCIPFKTIIPGDILKKRNKIEIEVTNLSFNQVIELDRKKVQWKNFYEINFVNIRYEPYDASDKEPVASGLLDDIKLLTLIRD